MVVTMCCALAYIVNDLKINRINETSVSHLHLRIYLTNNNDCKRSSCEFCMQIFKLLIFIRFHITSILNSPCWPLVHVTKPLSQQ